MESGPESLTGHALECVGTLPRSESDWNRESEEETCGWGADRRRALQALDALGRGRVQQSREIPSLVPRQDVKFRRILRADTRGFSAVAIVCSFKVRPRSSNVPFSFSPFKVQSKFSWALALLLEREREREREWGLSSHRCEDIYMYVYIS